MNRVTERIRLYVLGGEIELKWGKRENLSFHSSSRQTEKCPAGKKGNIISIVLVGETYTVST